MNNQNAGIFFDCERMKYPHTGLYHFCLQLGRALLRQRRPTDEELSFFLPKQCRDLFPGQPAVSPNPLFKQWMLFARNARLWHSTYQQSDYFPYGSRARKVLTIHDLNFLHENKSTRRRRYYLRDLQRKIEHTDSIVTISNFVRKELLEHLDIGGKEVSVVYNGCNIQDNVQARKPSFPVDRPFLLSIGAVVPKKNFHVLPATLLNNDFELIIAGVAGNREYQNRILEEASRLGVQNRIRITGPVTEEEKYWLLQNCELFCFPSLAEGFGLPVIEAMHFGKNVLLSPATSLPEIGGPYAHYFDSFDTDDISTVTTSALEQIQRSDVSLEIQNWSRQFSWTKTADDYLAIYRELLR